MGVKAWSNEQEKELIYKYQNETKDVIELSNHFNKGYRSVISKLVNLKIYKKPDKDEKPTRTVKVMLRDLETLLEIEIDGFNLNKKSNLEKLVLAIEEKLKE
jgi:hypothetical protein